MGIVDKCGICGTDNTELLEIDDKFVCSQCLASLAQSVKGEGDKIKSPKSRMGLGLILLSSVCVGIFIIKMVMGFSDLAELQGPGQDKVLAQNISEALIWLGYGIPLFTIGISVHFIGQRKKSKSQ
ncbi:MAG: hypothetical protein MJH11_03390 [Lentisphaeria bacterium]|nr:hypothetical protein [Lentisphaeria bacterium]